MRDLVETALGVILVTCLLMALLTLPCVVIDVVAGTNLAGPLAVALLLGVAAAAMLSIVTVQLARHSKGTSGRRRSARKSTDNKAFGDDDDNSGGRRR